MAGGLHTGLQGILNIQTDLSLKGPIGISVVNQQKTVKQSGADAIVMSLSRETSYQKSIALAPGVNVIKIMDMSDPQENVMLSWVAVEPGAEVIPPTVSVSATLPDGTFKTPSGKMLVTSLNTDDQILLKVTVDSSIKGPFKVTLADKDGKTKDNEVKLGRAENSFTLPLSLNAGKNVITVSSKNVDEAAETVNFTLEAKGAKTPASAGTTGGADGKKITVVHTDTVPGGATSTPITITVKNEDVETVKITVAEKGKDDAAATPLRNYFPEPLKLERGKEDYPVVVPLSAARDAATLVTVRGFDKTGKEIEVSKEATIKRGAASVRPRIEVGYSGLVNVENTSVPLSITANDPKISTLKIIVTPKTKDKATYFDVITLPRGEDSTLKVIGIPSDKEITVKVYDVSRPEDETEKKETPEEVRALVKRIYEEADFIPDGLAPLQSFQIERRSGGAPTSTIVTNSLNTRAIIGFEQAGASSADSKSQPFLDFFFTAPMRFKPKGDTLPRVSAWGQVRLAAVPQQVSTFGALPANFVSPLVENKLTDLVQGFDFMAGLEVRVFGTNKSYVSLIPGVKNQTFLHIIGGGGAISPLSRTANRGAAEIFTIPVEGSPQRELFKQRFPEAVENKAKYIAFVFPDRDRFLRQFYGGIRLKTFYFNDDGTLINRFPAIFDITIGQNEAVTGGRLQSDVTDENGKLLVKKARRYVLRLEAFYPFPIREANFLYLYGTAMMKIGQGGVKIDTPLFLDKPGTDINLTSNDIFITPTLQTNRDYYRFGIGVNLTELFNRTPPRERDR